MSKSENLDSPQLKMAQKGIGLWIFVCHQFDMNAFTKEYLPLGLNDLSKILTLGLFLSFDSSLNLRTFWTYVLQFYCCAGCAVLEWSFSPL